MVFTKHVWMSVEAYLTDWVNMLALRDAVKEQTGIHIFLHMDGAMYVNGGHMMEANLKDWVSILRNEREEVRNIDMS